MLSLKGQQYPLVSDLLKKDVLPARINCIHTQDLPCLRFAPNLNGSSSIPLHFPTNPSIQDQLRQQLLVDFLTLSTPEHYSLYLCLSHSYLVPRLLTLLIFELEGSGQGQGRFQFGVPGLRRHP